MRVHNLSTLLVLILMTGAVRAHDFWLVSDFVARPGQAIKIVAHTGDRFPTGDSPMALDRIARFELHGFKGKSDVSPIRVLEKSTEAEAVLRDAGTYILSMEIKPRFLELEAKKFQEYLEHEGLRQVLEMRAKDKKNTAPGKELYAKFAKSILRVGDRSDGVATRAVGFKLEIVPERDPVEVRPGEKLGVRVLFDGQPLPNAQVACVSDLHSGDGDYSFTTRTSYQGIAMIPIQNPGNWLVRLVHMIPAEAGKHHEWESFFSTLTFRIPPEKGFPLTVESIMRGAELVGYGISQVRWSGDSSRVYFSWRRPGEREAHTYMAPREGGTPKKLSEEEAKTAPPAFGGSFSKDRKRVVFSEDGDLILQDTVTGRRTTLAHTTEPELSPRFTKEENQVTFIRQNNLYRISLESGEIIQLTDFRQGPERTETKLTDSQKFVVEQQKELFEVIRDRAEAKARGDAKRKEKEKRKPYYFPARATVSGFELSPAQDWIVFSQSERAEQSKSTIVPNYVTDSGYTEDIQARTKVGDAPGRSQMGIVSVETGEIGWIDHGQKNREVNLVNPLWSDDGKNLIVTGIARDNKDRWILLVDPKTGKTRALDSLHDDAWVAGFFGGAGIGWMADNKNIYYVSEKDGYFQLYTAAIDGSGTRPLTSGKFEVFSPSLSQDKTKFYLTSSEVHPGERHFYSMPAGGGPRTMITGIAGSNQVTLSPDEKSAALIHSYSNKPPELYLMDAVPGAETRQITTTPTEEWRSFPWVDPQLITFKARDGAEVHARIYTPEMLASARKDRNEVGKGASRARKTAATAEETRPGVLFVHGAGYAQNAHRYWSSYYREYMFHHILMDRGYVVMDIDYRASSGYGRDWRTAIYRHMGGKDLDDQVDGARWMVKNLNVDPKRIGIYGGSYGGFITLMAMFTTPEVFAAGAALRPVTDWAHYNHPYTSNILNQPQADAEAYKRSSPIYLAEGLKGALLICHGIVDVNVHFQDTARLVQRLIELRKENWEAAIYPVEDHGFQQIDSWVDEYRRILKLFETHIENRGRPTRFPGYD